MIDALWYLGRSTGVVSLVLLTLVVALGIATRSGRPLPGLPRFAVTAVHRSASLLAVVFVAVHVLTLLFDPYAQLDLISLVVPFTAGAQPFWYGLGAVALDLILALIGTSLLRRHIGPRVWRAIHWTAYACWPIALAHSLGSGSDASTGWMLTITGICVAAVLGAVGWRLLGRFREVPEPLVPVEVTPAEDRFIAGEESAVVAALEGRAALPGDKLRRVVASGVHGHPTVVQNVESLAHVALIARFGAAWFRSRGTATEPGTALVTVSGAVGHPGVLEVAHGTPLRDVLECAGARHRAPVLVGGFHGAWLAPHEVDAAVFCRASLGEYGASTGAGVLIVLPPAASGMSETALIAAYLAGQSARQCGPCFNGLPRMAELLARVAAGDPDPRLVDELHRLTDFTAGRGACHHPDGTVRLVRSALRVFGPGNRHDIGYEMGANR